MMMSNNLLAEKKGKQMLLQYTLEIDAHRHKKSKKVTPIMVFIAMVNPHVSLQTPFMSKFDSTNFTLVIAFHASFISISVQSTGMIVDISHFTFWTKLLIFSSFNPMFYLHVSSQSVAKKHCVTFFTREPWRSFQDDFSSRMFKLIMSLDGFSFI